MKKKIAVVTGASSGMGREFVRTMEKLGAAPDEVWVIARREERLRELECPFPLRLLPMDLTRRESLKKYEELLKSEPTEVLLLINASGYGKFNATADIPLETNLNMVELNVQALQALCQLTLPCMSRGARILNIASVAAFQPIPYINVYAATKAFVLSYSRGLNRELKSRGISVTALCPFWTRTEFMDVAEGKNNIVKKYTAVYEVGEIVNRAWRDLLRGRDLSQYGFIAEVQAFFCKILPHKWIMDIWLRQQKL